MVTRQYPVEIEILLKPVGTPDCKIILGNQQINLPELNQEKSIVLHHQGQGSTRLTIEHYGRHDHDPTTAVIVEKIRFNEITSTKFIYQGIYYPNYPKHLFGSIESIPHQNYLSWNGVWHLDFTLPIYIWIHKVEDLGWIYD